jgi:hypothetical protein
VSPRPRRARPTRSSPRTSPKKPATRAKGAKARSTRPPATPGSDGIATISRPRATQRAVCLRAAIRRAAIRRAATRRAAIRQAAIRRGAFRLAVTRPAGTRRAHTARALRRPDHPTPQDFAGRDVDATPHLKVETSRLRPRVVTFFPTTRAGRFLHRATRRAATRREATRREVSRFRGIPRKVTRRKAARLPAIRRRGVILEHPPHSKESATRRLARLRIRGPTPADLPLCAAAPKRAAKGGEIHVGKSRSDHANAWFGRNSVETEVRQLSVGRRLELGHPRRWSACSPPTPTNGSPETLNAIHFDICKALCAVRGRIGNSRLACPR